MKKGDFGYIYDDIPFSWIGFSVSSLLVVSVLNPVVNMNTSGGINFKHFKRVVLF